MPTLMLCEPVTYETEPCRLYRSGDFWYSPPPVATDAAWLCVANPMSRYGAPANQAAVPQGCAIPGWSRFSYRSTLLDQPPSMSSLLLTVDVHFAVVVR